MEVLLVTHPRYVEHSAGAHHPERPVRLGAVLDGALDAGLGDALRPVEARGATVAELERVHTPEHVSAIDALARRGGGAIDPDTAMSAQSYDVALLAAGAGLTAVERLRAGDASAAFCAVRPPGHHASRDRAMGFCLFNNVAVTAAALADEGERVLVVDYDVHHGNGTQAIFWDDPRVAYVSMHEHPLYPGTGRLDETGGPAAPGTTTNLPFPCGTTGDALVAACEEVVAEVAETFAPTWLLLSAGFDAHRRDPLAGLELSAGDFMLLTDALARLVPAGRRIAFLEGGYDLEALRASAAACVGALGGTGVASEAPTSGGPGREVVEAALKVRARVLDL